jgi:xanthosine utilization system XapX-like protein
MTVLGRRLAPQPGLDHRGWGAADVRHGIRLSLVVFAASRLVTFVVALAIAAASDLSATQVLTRWDGGWYLGVVERGYPDVVAEGVGAQAQTTLGFFPGYPLLIQAGSSLTGLSPALVGIVISTLAGAAISVVLWLLAQRIADNKAADRTVVLFCFFPSAFVLSMVYAEALFLLLVAICLLALVREWWTIAGVAAGLAGLVRPNGLVLILCCGWAAVQAIRRHRSWRAATAPLLAPIGTLAFFSYLQVHTGDWLAYVHTQKRGWDQGFDFGISNVRTLLAVIADRRLGFYTLMLAVCMLAIVAMLYFLVRWRMPAPILIYVVGIVGFALLSSNTTSVPRFLLTAFPVLIPIAQHLSDDAYPTAVAASATLMATLFWTTSLVTWLAP